MQRKLLQLRCIICGLLFKTSLAVLQNEEKPKIIFLTAPVFAWLLEEESGAILFRISPEVIDNMR